VGNNDAAARCVNIGGDSLKNEGDRGSDREKVVLKVETVDVSIVKGQCLSGWLDAHCVEAYQACSIRVKISTLHDGAFP
jgi:hypothetical protein